MVRTLAWWSGLRCLLVGGAVASGLVGGVALAQVSTRAEPVAGPGVITIGGIASNASVNVRSGPAVLFPAIGTLGYGTRVRRGLCVGGGSAQWCQVQTMDGTVSGYVSGQFLVEGAGKPPGAGLDGGPPYWKVQGVPAGARLNVRRDPAATSPALATLREGEVVKNLGCSMSSGSRWCRIRAITGMDVTGWVSARYLTASRGPVAIQPPVKPSPGGGGGAHGPDAYVVTGLTAGDYLNIRSQPSAQSTILARLAQGARVRNLGCQQSGQTRWCRIETTGGVKLTGWVSGRYLREG